MTMFTDKNDLLNQVMIRRAMGWPRPSHESPQCQQMEAQMEAALVKTPPAERAAIWKGFRALLMKQLQEVVYDFTWNYILEHQRNPIRAEVQAMLAREFPEAFGPQPQAKRHHPGVVYLDPARKAVSA